MMIVTQTTPKQLQSAAAVPRHEIAVVILCEQGDASGVGAAVEFQQHHRSGCIYVVEYGDSLSSFGSVVKELLDDLDLHTINYVVRRTQDPRKALKDVCAAKLTHFSEVLLIGTQKVVVDSLVPETCYYNGIASSNLLNPAMSNAFIGTEASSKKRLRFESKKSELVHQGTLLPRSQFLEGTGSDFNQYLLGSWRRTDLLMHLRNELRRCKWCPHKRPRLQTHISHANPHSSSKSRDAHATAATRA